MTVDIPTTPLSKFIASRNFVAVIKLDSQGRKGRTVTIVDSLPKQTLFLTAMIKSLKAICGAGGSILIDGKDGAIEIQGDQREKIRVYLAAENIKFRG